MRSSAFYFSISIVLVLASSLAGNGLQAPTNEQMKCGDRETMKLALRPRDRGGKLEARGRDFLWRHWSEKKCATLDLTTWSREGNKNLIAYAIDFDTSGALVLRVKVSRVYDPSAPISGVAAPNGVIPPPQAASSASYEAHSVERVVPSIPFVLEEAKSIPDAKQVEPNKYVLRFKDKAGTIITSF
jgi:hypothetical protein